MSRRHPAPAITCVVVLAVAIAWGPFRPRPASGEEFEFLRGTVEKFRPGALSLLDVTYGGENDVGTPIVVIVNDKTEFFDGPVRATKESLEPGVRVLVRCERAGPGWLALVVRIIGGKAQEPASGAP